VPTNRINNLHSFSFESVKKSDFLERCQRAFFNFIWLAESLIHTAHAARVELLGNSASVWGALAGILFRSSQIQTLRDFPGSQADFAASIQVFSSVWGRQYISATAGLLALTVQADAIAGVELVVAVAGWPIVMAMASNAMGLIVAVIVGSWLGWCLMAACLRIFNCGAVFIQTK
jgi:F0F1-type ATP synthase assembly protein I